MNKEKWNSVEDILGIIMFLFFMFLMAITFTPKKDYVLINTVCGILTVDLILFVYVLVFKLRERL